MYDLIKILVNYCLAAVAYHVYRANTIEQICLPLFIIIFQILIKEIPYKSCGQRGLLLGSRPNSNKFLVRGCLLSIRIINILIINFRFPVGNTAQNSYHAVGFYLHCCCY